MTNNKSVATALHVNGDGSRLHTAMGSRVFVLDDKGFPWKATIRGKRSNGFSVHYDGHKMSSTYWVSSERVVGSIPVRSSPTNRSAVSENRSVFLNGALENSLQDDVRYQVIRGSWSFMENGAERSFQLIRVVPPTEDFGGLVDGEFLFRGSFNFDNRDVTESAMLVFHFRKGGSSKGIISVNGRGKNDFGVFKLAGQSTKRDTDDSIYSIQLRKDYIIQIGAAVSKLFVDNQCKVRPFEGKVVSYDLERDKYMVCYEDGDQEELSEEEVVDILASVSESCSTDTIARKQHQKKKFIPQNSNAMSKCDTITPNKASSLVELAVSSGKPGLTGKNTLGGSDVVPDIQPSWDQVQVADPIAIFDGGKVATLGDMTIGVNRAEKIGIIRAEKSKENLTPKNRAKKVIVKQSQAPDLRASTYQQRLSNVVRKVSVDHMRNKLDASVPLCVNHEERMKGNSRVATNEVRTNISNHERTIGSFDSRIELNTKSGVSSARKNDNEYCYIDSLNIEILGDHVRKVKTKKEKQKTFTLNQQKPLGRIFAERDDVIRTMGYLHPLVANLKTENFQHRNSLKDVGPGDPVILEYSRSRLPKTLLIKDAKKNQDNCSKHKTSPSSLQDNRIKRTKYS